MRFQTSAPAVFARATISDLFPTSLMLDTVLLSRRSFECFLIMSIMFLHDGKYYIADLNVVKTLNPILTREESRLIKEKQQKISSKRKTKEENST